MIPTGFWLAALWYGFRHAWSFPLVIVLAFAAWAALVVLPYLVRRLS